jgi:RHS repeat-associated protein
MRRARYLVRRGLTLVLIPVFLASALLSGIPPANAAPASTAPSQPTTPTPLAATTASVGVPEDPLATQSEHQTPEIFVGVDVRDGHLIERVVDDWGPGRVPLIMRSWTGVGNSPSGAGNWQFNHFLDVQPIYDSYGNINSFNVLERDGNRYGYTLLTSRGTGPSFVFVYEKKVGAYSTLEAQMNCIQRAGDIRGFYWDCTYGWTGTATGYLPKGVIRQYSGTTDLSTCQTTCSVTRAVMTSEQDANGNTFTHTVTSLTEQDHPYIASVTDPVGRVTTYSYEAYNRIGYQSCTDIRCTCCSWSTFYRVKTATDPYGQVVTYAYAAAGPAPLVSVTNAAGFITRYSYDTSGNLSSVTDARGFATTIAWAGTVSVRMPGPVVVQVTAPDGSATKYGYTFDVNAYHTSTTVTDARGNVTTHALTTVGDVYSITDPLGNVTQFVYDGNHNVTQVTDARTPGIVTTYAYNARNKITQVVRDTATLKLTTNLSWDNVDNLLSVTNPRGISTNNTYDANNNLTSVRRAVGTTDEALTQYTYTPWGGVASLIDPRGNTTTYAYTARHQIQTVTLPVGGTTTYAYDAFDNQASMTDGNGHTWTTAYNTSRLPTTATDPAGNTVGFAYDANGNRTSATDAKHQVTTFAYDSSDRLTTITDPFNGKTGYQYDVVGNLIKITNARNFSANLAYDAANRLTQVTDALGQATTSGYDAVGNRISVKDRKGTTSNYSYDQVNRLTQVSGGGITVAYTYDASGNRLTMVDPTGTTGYTYDSLDRLTRTTYPDAKSVQYAYDKTGNRTGLTYPGGTTTLGYAYDAANRLTQITQGTLSWSFGYDGAGNRTSLNQPNGTSTTYAYLINNWLSSITHKGPGGAAFQTISYTYDANGNRITQADTSGTTTLSYDALNRLVQVAYPGTYGNWSWAYDPVGNRTSQTAPGGITTYAYDGNNRLTQAGGVVYTYDANGNLTGTTAGQSFTYDVFNRMTQAVGTGGTATYTYNGNGLKIQRVGPDGTTRYYYDGFRPIWETDGIGTITAQLDRDIFGNLLSRREASGVRRYYHPDGLGSTNALTDETGNLLASMLYDAWGNVRASSADVGKYRFAGAELDTASGLYHMGARFYDPSIGRWLSEDPKQDKVFNPLALNFYAYVNNTPLTLVDPDGLDIDAATLSLGLGIALEVPVLGEVLLAGALGYGAFRLLDWGISEFSRAKIAGEVKTRADTLAKHLAAWLGRSVAGTPPEDPKKSKDPRYQADKLKQALRMIRGLLDRVNGDFSELEKILGEKGYSEEQIKDLIQAIKEAQKTQVTSP